MCAQKSNHLVKKKKKKKQENVVCSAQLHLTVNSHFHFTIFKQITPLTLFPFSRRCSTIRICNESFSIDATKFKYDYAHFVTLFQKRRFIVYVCKTERYKGRGYPRIYFHFCKYFRFIFIKRENRNDQIILPHVQYKSCIEIILRNLYLEIDILNMNFSKQFLRIFLYYPFSLNIEL